MKRRVLLLMSALILYGVSFAQPLSGVKTIPGDYPSVDHAIQALNTQGVEAPGVTFNIAAGYTETFAALNSGLVTATGTVSAPIIFQKAGGGVNPIITAAKPGTGTADYIFCLSGSDYITFDGIDVIENVDNTTSVTRMEWGYAILKASATDGSQHVTIQNCNITMNKANLATYGIYSHNVTLAAPATALVVTALSGTNSYNRFYGNTITNSYSGIYMFGCNDAVTPPAMNDQGNDIGSVASNTLTNFGGGASVCWGVYFARQNNVIVANNNISIGAGSTSSVYGISGGFTATNASINIYGNTIQIDKAGAVGAVYGIYNSLGGNGTINTINIYNNTVHNCNQPNNTREFYGIYSDATANIVNLYGNVIENNVFGGGSTIYLCGTNTAATGIANVYNNTISNNSQSSVGTQIDNSILTILNVYGPGAAYVHDNNIFNNSVAPASASYGGAIYCLRAYNTSRVFEEIYNNSIHDQTITAANASYINTIYGIYAAPTTPARGFVRNNTIHHLIINLSSTANGQIFGIWSTCLANVFENTIYSLYFNSTSSGSGTGTGIWCGGAGIYNIYKNKVYDISMAGASGSLYGIQLSTGATTTNVYNNYISDLRTPASNSVSSSGGLHGIYISSPANLFYNTIFLNCTNTSTTTFRSDAIYASTTSAVQLRNNILVNTSTAPASTAYSAAAYRRSSNTLTTYAATSNNNLFYTGIPSATNLIFTDGTNNIQTLNAYKTFVTTRDAASVTEFPPFVDATGKPYNLHLQTTVATQCESGGSTVSTPDISTDYDNDARYPASGYPDNVLTPATSSDIGADEFAGLLYPVVITTAATGTTVTTATLNGTVNPAAEIVTVFFDYGLTILYGTTVAGIPSPISGNTTQSVSIPVEGLTGNTAYHYRLRGITGSGVIVYGNDMVFTTMLDLLSLTGVAGEVTGCYGNANGTITTVVSGGVSPYAYLWNNSATTQNLSGLIAGNYSVTVTDAMSGTITGSWVVIQPSELSLAAVITDASCPAAADGTIELTVTGGTPAYNFLWSNSATGQNIGGLDPGIYTVTVTDNNLCQKTGTWSVGQTSPVCANVIVSGDITTTVCYNATNTITVAGGATSFVVQTTGSATFIAGVSIIYLPGTAVLSGGYMLGTIYSGSWCGGTKSVTLPAFEGNDFPASPGIEQSCFSIYPNPTTGSFTLVQKGDKLYGNVTVEVFSMRGEKVMTETIIGEQMHDFRFSDMATGLYFVKVVADGYVETMKLVIL